MSLPRWVRAAPLALLLVVFVALPLVVLLARAVGLPEVVAPDRLVFALRDPDSRAALWASTWTSAATSALSVLIGVPLAFILGRLELPRARALRAWLTLPAVVPPYLMAIAWVDLGAPKNGLLNVFASALGASGPVMDVYGPAGIVWVMGLCYQPFVLLPVLNALERLDASLEESARLSGASPLRVTLEISLPLVWPAIAGGAVLVFLAAAATFGVPYLLGTAGSSRFWVLTTAIVSHLTVGGHDDLESALSLAFALLVVSALVSALGAWTTRAERRYAVVSGKSPRPRKLRVSPAVRRAALAWVWVVIGVSTILPVVTLAGVSILKVWGGGLGPSNWSLAAYQRVLIEDRRTLPALGRSLMLASAAASAAVVIGGLAAHARVRRPSWWTRGVAALLELPYAVPGTVVALALLMTFSQPIRIILLERATLSFDLFAGSWALLVAYAVKYLAFGVRLGTSGLVQLDASLEEAARVSGASPTRTLIDVVAPLLWPSLGAAWLLVFLPALSEITMSVLLVGPGTPVVGTVLFELQSYADPPSAAVLAVILVALTIAGNALARRWTGGEAQARG